MTRVRTGQEAKDAACSRVHTAPAAASSSSVPRFSRFSEVKRNYIIVKRLGVGAGDPAKGSSVAWCTRGTRSLHSRLLSRTLLRANIYISNDNTNVYMSRLKYLKKASKLVSLLQKSSAASSREIELFACSFDRCKDSPCQRILLALSLSVKSIYLAYPMPDCTLTDTGLQREQKSRSARRYLVQQVSIMRANSRA